jgi:YwiC-like protein
MPSEHGGWGLTLEPVLLGLMVAPSAAGLAIGLAAFVAFLMRTPVKLVLVDRWRHRWLARTRLAAGIAGVELLVLAGLAFAAIASSGWAWLWPVAVAMPLVAVELWFDMRSRGRRLIPELAGSIGIGATAAAIPIAGGEPARLAVGLWVLIAARTVASIPFVRVQIERLRKGTAVRTGSDIAQLAGVAAAAAAVLVDDLLVVGAVAVAALAFVHVVWVRRPPVPAKVLGLRELVLGVVIVAAAAWGVQS